MGNIMLIQNRFLAAFMLIFNIRELSLTFQSGMNSMWWGDWINMLFHFKYFTQTHFCWTKMMFLPPTGAQGVYLSVCLSVRLSVCLWGTKCSRALILLSSGSYLQADFKITSRWLHDDFIQRALRRILKKSNQREREQSDFVIPSEPKIFRLVLIKTLFRS